MIRDSLHHLYGRLAALHPRAFRETFAQEMQQVFAAQLAEVPPGAPLGLAAFTLREFAGLLASVTREHWAATTQRHRRPAIILGLALYALSLALLALGFQQAAPGPDGQALYGLAIGQPATPGGVVYLSGRRLACPPGGQLTAPTRCTITIAGAPLELLVQRSPRGAPDQLGGSCRARYQGREWPCQIGLRHVHVAWFAFIPLPLDLSPAQLELLRHQHPLENLPEPVVLSLVLLVPGLTAVIVAGAIRLWFRGQRRRVLVTGASIVGGIGAWALTLPLLFAMTRSFWD